MIVGGGHRHYGYWIDRELGTARCYECQFQFAGTEGTAEDWNPPGFGGRAGSEANR